MAHLSISLLGSFHVTLDEEPVTGFESARVRALLSEYCCSCSCERVMGKDIDIEEE